MPSPGAILLDRSRFCLAVQAFDDDLARKDWQIAEIEAGLAKAARGEFATSQDLAQVIAKYVVPEREP